MQEIQLHDQYVCCVRSVDDKDGEIKSVGLRNNNSIETEFVMRDTDGF